MHILGPVDVADVQLHDVSTVALSSPCISRLAFQNHKYIDSVAWLSVLYNFCRPCTL